MGFQRFKCCVIPYHRERYIIMSVLIIALVFQFTIKGTFDVAIVTFSEGDGLDEAIKAKFAGPRTIHIFRNRTGSFESWRARRRAIIEMSLQISSVVGNPICGIIADLYGGKFIIVTGILVNICLSIGFPFAVRWCPWWAIAVIACGIGSAQCMIVIPQTTILAYWIPSNDITYFSCFVNAGPFIGTMITSLIASSTDLSKTPYLLLWLYVSFGVVAFLLVALNIFSAPWKHPCITVTAKKALQNVSGDQFPKKIRWKEIIRDHATWSIWMGIIGHNWMYVTLFTNLETNFMLSKTLSMSMWFVQIPAACGMVGTLAAGMAANKVVSNGKVPILYIRSMANIGGGMICCILAIIADRARSIYIEMLAILSSMLCLGIGFSGSHVNVYDITRHYSGTIIGMANCLTSAISFITNITINFLSSKEIRKDHWEKLLWLSFFVCLVSMILCFVWLEAEKRHWDQIVIEEYEEDEGEEDI